MTWSRRAAWTAISTLTLLFVNAACNDTTPPPGPISFARASRVAFVCVDLTLPVGDEAALVPMDKCYPNTDGTENGYGMHALVLQSSRGEVAAVDVRHWRVLDNRNDIPGKTFVPTGEVPVAIVTAPDHPEVIYVANGASRDITVLRTSSTMLQVPGQPSMLQRFRLKQPDSQAADEPFDMVLSPDQDALFVSSLAGGWLLRIPIQRCSDGSDKCDGAGLLDEANLLRIPLEQSWSKLAPDAFLPDAAGSGDEPYRYTCELNPPLLMSSAAPPALPAADADVGAPQPSGMAVDAFCEAGSCTRRLLIADAHQPIVHAIDLDKLTPDASPADAILTPILTGAPTERLAVTPRVPRDLTSDAETQYVYAIDVRDGSVIVTQDGRIKNVGVNPAVRADRLDLGPTGSTATIVAMSLEVVSPKYDVRGPVSQWVRAVDQPASDNAPLECVDNNHQRRLSQRLRGVFLAVGATDGTVRFINVHDMELRECRSCTSGEMPSYQPFKAGFDPLPVVRNNPRLATYSATDLNAKPLIVPSVLPQFGVNGAVIGVKADGTTNDTRVAGLDCITCADEQAISFPTDATVTGGVTTTADGGVAENGEDGSCSAGQGRVCSVADPYVEPRNWQAVYEGPIPGTLGGRGRFLPKSSPDNQTGSLEFVGDTAFCEVGVLGDDQLAAGDQLVITSPLPTDALRTELDRDCPACQPLDQGERDLCNKLVDARDAGDRLIAFGIRRAFNGRVQVTPELITPRAVNATWEQVWKCFAGLPLTYQVRSRESFIVRDLGDLGFRHRVIARPDSGLCVIDETQDPQRVGRVRRGERFDNGLIAFQPRDGNFAPLTVLNLGSISNAPKVILSIADSTGTTGWQGVMPVDMRYSPIDQQLYIVDPTVRGLLQVSLDPVSSVVSADRTIQ